MSLIKAAVLFAMALLGTPGADAAGAAAQATEQGGGALRGSHWEAAACECRDECRDRPAYTRTWDGHRWRTDCCACPADSRHNRTGGGEVPEWCRYVPDEFKDDACHGVGRSCGCQAWCRHTPASAREMIPECCGCAEADLPAPRGDAPEWCEYVPEAYRQDACTDCACRDWCQDTPLSSWQWNPQCCACDRANVTARNETRGAGRRPEWCRHVPEEDHEEICRGAGHGCRCRDWCASTPIASRGWNPECCGCEEVARPRDGLPDWCQYVPEESHGDMCNDREHSCQCKDWCRDTPSLSWGWNPQCCGCERGSLPRPGHGETGGGVPEWCQFVPEQYQGVACHGDGRSCTCRDWCDEVPSFTWMWNPECCGCEADGGRPPRPGHDGRRDVPAWCAHIPEGRRDETCRSGGVACACRPWCANTPEFSRHWHPECCGCAASGHDDEHDGGRHRGEVPEWCRYIPPLFRAGVCRERDGGDRCMCIPWCMQVPAVEHGGMQQCCGCPRSP